MFWRAIFKNYCPFCNQRPRVCLIVKFGAETKILKFETKMPNLSVFELKFENTIVIIEISALEFVLFESLVQKKKSLHLGPKMCYLGTFGREF